MTHFYLYKKTSNGFRIPPMHDPRGIIPVCDLFLGDLDGDLKLPTGDSLAAATENIERKKCIVNVHVNK